jgi:hypothetical protein
MAERQPSSIELSDQLQPFFSLFARVGTAAERDVLAGMAVLGVPRHTERASDFHRAWRNNLRRVCDLAPQFFTLREEPEGKGLDYLICNLNPKMPFTLRWGRYNGTTIRRNRTERTAINQEQGVLFDSLLEGLPELPVLTLAHTIEDEFTFVGQSQLWIGRLYLLREREEQSEVITEVHVYSPPNRSTVNFETPAPIIVQRQDEDGEWQRIINDIKRSA